MTKRIYGITVNRRNCPFLGAIPLLRLWRKITCSFVVIMVIFTALTGCDNEDDELVLINAAQKDTVEIKEKTVPDEVSTDVPATITKTSAAENICDNQKCFVYVCGAVNNPDVYILSSENHIVDAIEASGGFCDDADINYLNLAEKINDGMRIYVPVIGETVTEPVAVQNSGTESGLVNINTADADKLMSIPGIGKSKADKIISYREKNGSFGSISDIMNVDGIKNGMYDKIKDFITVN